MLPEGVEKAGRHVTKAVPGEFIYLSDRKLLNLAHATVRSRSYSSGCWTDSATFLTSTSRRRASRTAWFRFDRELRFGVGYPDDDHSVNAFLLVDRNAVDESGFTFGLLLNGSAVHVSHPYRRDDLADYPGNRSGSGTGRLFEWMVAADAARELDLDADIDRVTPDGSLGVRSSGEAAVGMYRLFARDDWMTPASATCSITPRARA